MQSVMPGVMEDRKVFKVGPQFSRSLVTELQK